MARTIWKRIAVAIGAAVGFMVAVTLVSDLISGVQLNRRYVVRTPEVIDVSRDSATVARGEHLGTTILQCTACHGDDLGGRVVHNSGLVMTIAGPNLTRGRGGVGADLSISDWEHAIRHGVAPDGRALRVMPAIAYVNLSDPDVEAVIAWATQVPPINREVPATRLGPIGNFMSVTRLYPVADAALLSPDTTHPAAVPPAVTSAYGHYLSIIAGCTDCHGKDLAGGRVPGSPTSWPPASNLTPTGIGSYSEIDFSRALRTGRRPDGVAIDTVMPWPRYAGLTDQEVAALDAYLRTLPPTPTPVPNGGQ